MAKCESCIATKTATKIPGVSINSQHLWGSNMIKFRFFRACVIGFLLGVLLSVAPASASAEPQLYAINNFGPFLNTVDPLTGAALTSVVINIPGETVNSSNGLAVNPQTNEMYAAVKLMSQGGPGRNLIRINPLTGDAVNIGNMGEPVASLAFTDTGVLYAVTGDCAGGGCGGAATPETLFTVNTANASLTLVLPLGNGNDGEAIAFNPDDGFMYHMSGQGAGFIFEKIHLGSGTVTNIPLSGDLIDNEEAIGFTYDPAQGLFVGGLIDWEIEEGTYGTITADGVLTAINSLEIPWKDYAFWNASIDSDGDGVPDDEDDCPFDPTETIDTDGDEICNNDDLDDDNDGLLDAVDPWPLGRFADVDPATHFAFQFIETLERSGVTGGCGGVDYCPDNPVTRAQMAVFLERGINGSGFTPPPATGLVFGDIGTTSFGAAFIEQMFADGITGGCGGGNYCPNNPVTRAQMAVFLLRAKHGAGYMPPPATGSFNDVPIGSYADAWVEQLAAEGITSGCGNGNYCPSDPVTRAQMAVFLVKSFGL